MEVGAALEAMLGPARKPGCTFDFEHDADSRRWADVAPDEFARPPTGDDSTSSTPATGGCTDCG